MIDPRISFVEVGAVLIGTLAYPASRRDAGRVTGHLICNAVELMDGDPERYGAAPAFLRYACQARDSDNQDRQIKRAARLVSLRLAAAKQAFPKFHSTIADYTGQNRPKHVPLPTSQEMLLAISIDMSEKSRDRDGRGARPVSGETEFNPGNIKTRIWKLSKPVLHLALALHATIGNDPGLSVGDILFDGDRTSMVIETSRAWAPLVSLLFDIPPDEQIMIE